MDLYHSILALILTWQIPPAEHPERELGRLATVAQAVAIEAELVPGGIGPRRAAAHALAIWYGESKLAEHVHRGGSTPGGSDDGAARCLGQIHDTGLLEPGEWYALAGTDLESTRNCARVTLRIVQRFARWCGYDMARMHGAYGTGLGCVVRGWAVARAREARAIERVLR